MAIEFARVQYVKRSDGGNVCRSAAYNAREDIRCDRTGERFYFSHRGGVLHHEVMLPAEASPAFADAETLWNAAQAMEKRKDSQEARELLLALPSDPGLGLDDWRAMVEAFATEHFVSKGVAVQIDIHAPPEGDRNYHAHLLITTRRIEGDQLSQAKARDLDPEIRRGRNGKPLVAEGDAWSLIWRDHQNRYFEERGLDLRVDEPGVVAQRHEGPVRLRTVPEEAKARAAGSAAENEAAARDPERVLAALTRHRATFTELDIERLLRKPVPDVVERAALRAEILAHPSVVALHARDTGEFAGRYTTTLVREEEEAVLKNAATINRGVRAVAASHVAATVSRRTLDDEQHAAVLRATGTDGLVMIEGIAGAGKSYSVEAIREAHERDGWRVIGLAPTNTVAADLRASGFKHGSTVHLELFYQDNARHDRAPVWNAHTCVVVDEAAMLDTKTLRRLTDHAAATGAKLVLTGDDRQLASIERGGMFTELKARHGSALIAKVRRQESDWQRAASEDFAGGRVAEGLHAYAEHNCLHWGADLDEARTRLLSDWDQDSRQRPGINRFVYASTNIEVNRLNQEIRAIRARRGEVGPGVAVETSRGAFDIGVGDRLQFYGNNRKEGYFNGTLGTVRAVEGRVLSVETDSGRMVRIDPAEFKEFGLGYAGTVYRGQGKTQMAVQALYDSAFAWNARTAYVGMTRHKQTVNLYVPAELAAGEEALARQMSKRMRDEASLAYATAAEVVDLAAARRKQEAQPPASSPASAPAPAPAAANVAAGKTAEPPRQSAPVPPVASSRPAAPAGGFPREEIAALRRLDLTAYARDVHGFNVQPDPAGPHRYRLTRAASDGRLEMLEVLYVPGGYWTFRNPAAPLDRGDIIDLARREGAPNLAAARAEIAAYWANRSETMREPENRQRREEEKPRPEVDPQAPDAAVKQQAADEQRKQDIAGAAEADRQDAIAAETERRQQAARDEATKQQAAREDAAKQQALQKEEVDRHARLTAASRQAGELERARLRQAQQTPPAQQDQFIASSADLAERARERTGIAGPEASARARSMPAIDPMGFPASASLRYAESLAGHYDERDHWGSLSRASLAESGAFQRDQQELHRAIALEPDADRREMLLLRRGIEHSDYMGQTWGRIAGLSQAISGRADAPHVVAERQKAQDFQDSATRGRQLWEQKCIEHPGLYAPLNEQMRARVDAARQAASEPTSSPSPTVTATATAPSAASLQTGPGQTEAPGTVPVRAAVPPAETEVEAHPDRAKAGDKAGDKTGRQTAPGESEPYPDWTKNHGRSAQRAAKDDAAPYPDWTQEVGRNRTDKPGTKPPVKAPEEPQQASPKPTHGRRR